MVQIGQRYEVDSYFSMHRGCHVTLYQDTKVPLDLPHFNMVKGPNDCTPTPKSCWADLYHSINEVIWQSIFRFEFGSIFSERHLGPRAAKKP